LERGESLEEIGLINPTKTLAPIEGKIPGCGEARTTTRIGMIAGLASNKKI
jgi:hypothetical protein